MKKVSIVIAVYNPNLKWFEQQLQSINNQNFGSIEVIVVDDCSTQVDFCTIKAYVKCHITKYDCRVYRNESNIGSNKTFERLTKLACGEYIAYCDQDDIWEPEKISLLFSKLEETGAVLCYSDMSVIDKDDEAIALSITKVRKRRKFKSGLGLAPELIFRNFVSGCTIMIKSNIAKAALPFEDSMVHDQWLTLYSATKGEIAFIKQALVKYRIHSNNQTPVLKGVNSKKEYYDERIILAYKRFKSLQNRMSDINELSETIKKALLWAQARMDYFNGRFSAAKVIWKYRHLSYPASLFEIIALKSPEPVFKILIKLIKQNII